jgi:hypothetical protein
VARGPVAFSPALVPACHGDSKRNNATPPRRLGRRSRTGEYTACVRPQRCCVRQHSDADAEPNSDNYANQYEHAYSHVNADPDGYADQYRDGHPDADPDSYAGTPTPRDREDGDAVGLPAGTGNTAGEGRRLSGERTPAVGLDGRFGPLHFNEWHAYRGCQERRQIAGGSTELQHRSGRAHLLFRQRHAQSSPHQQFRQREECD